MTKWEVRDFKPVMTSQYNGFSYVLVKGEQEIKCYARGNEQAVQSRINKALKRLNDVDAALKLKGLL